MKSNLNVMIVLAAALAAFSACEKPEPSQGTGVTDTPQEVPVVAEPISGYEYDGKEYPVYSVAFVSNATQIAVKISPFKEDEKQTTYSVIGINSALEGVEIDVSSAWHNDDYYFIYEDPVMYYSQYRQLLDGTIMIRKKAQDVYEVFADIVLPDGKTFRFEYR